MHEFGTHLRKRREALGGQSGGYSLRKVATDAGINASYLSQIENGRLPPPGEDTVKRLAEVLEEDPDVLLALAGKVSSDLQAIIAKRPALFAELLRSLRNQPDHAILRVVREVRDGDW